jgi:hypothetical protein
MLKHIKFLQVLLGLAFFLIFSPHAMAQTSCVNLPSESASQINFTDKDQELITRTKSENDLRFNRDYKGKIFAACVSFARMVKHEGLTRGDFYTLMFNSSRSFSEPYWCEVSAEDASKFIDSNNGDPYFLVGVIDDAWTVHLELTGCNFLVLKRY